jgi:prephenate dehydrogenase
VASALAGQLVHESDAVLGLVGQGFRDMTRIAASEPELWADIAVSNAAPLAAAIARLVSDLSAVRDALQGAADQRSRRSQPAVRRLLRSGQAGHARIPGKHGGAPRRYDTVPVLVPDQPGALAKLFADAGRAGINIEDLRVDHAPGMPVGVVELLVRPSASPRLRRELTQRGWELTGR